MEKLMTTVALTLVSIAAGFLDGPYGENYSCTMHGCDPARSFSQSDFVIPAKSHFELSWIYNMSDSKCEGCITNGDDLVCLESRDEQLFPTAVMSLDPYSGSLLWRYSFSNISRSLPTFDKNGHVVFIDGSVISVVEVETGSVINKVTFTKTYTGLTDLISLWNGSNILFASQDSGEFVLIASERDSLRLVTTINITEQGKPGNWKSLNAPAFNQDSVSATGYFYAFNEQAKIMRLYAVVVTPTDPYFKIKWYRQLGYSEQYPPESFRRQHCMVSADGFIALSMPDGNTLMLKDTGSEAAIIFPFTFESSGMATFKEHRPRALGSPYGQWIWIMSNDTLNNQSSLVAWDTKVGYPIRIYEQYKVLGVQTIKPVTELTIVGRQFLNQTLVYVAETSNQGQTYQELLAFQADDKSETLDFKARMIFRLNIPGLEFQGQIVGVKDKMLIIFAQCDRGSHYFGYQIMD